MVKQMKLRGDIRLENGHKFFHGPICDGDTFSIHVYDHDVELNEPFTEDKKQVAGWLYVIQEAQQNDSCYLTLPQASIRFGRQITVSELYLMPRNATLADFNPQKQGKNAPVEPKVGKIQKKSSKK